MSGNLNPQPTPASIGLGNVPNVDCTNADNITSGTLDIARLPALAYSNTVQVPDQAARFALTIAQVQNGDTVAQLDTQQLYLVVDDTQLNNAAGYLAYVANVDWMAITNKPQPVLDLLGVNTGNETAQSVGNITAGATAETAPDDADSLGFSDNSAGNILKRLTFANLKTWLAAYFDGLYPAKPVGSAILKGDGAGGFASAVPGTDYVAPNAPVTAATKTKVTYDASGRITAGADATTADIDDSLNRRYTTDAQQVVLNNTSGVNSGNETATTIGAIVTGAATKATPADADLLPLSDSTAGGIIKGLSWANVKATLLSYFQGLFLALPGSNGIAVRTGATTATARTIQGVSGLLDITNGDGVAGNPTITPNPTSANFTTTTDYTVTSAAYASINAAVRLSGLAAGKYLVWCTAQLSNNQENEDAWLGIFSGNAGATTLATGGETAGRFAQNAVLYPTYVYELPVTVLAVVTITGTQIIEPKVKSASGSVTCYNVSLSALRIG